MAVEIKDHLRALRGEVVGEVFLTGAGKDGSASPGGCEWRVDVNDAVARDPRSASSTPLEAPAARITPK